MTVRASTHSLAFVGVLFVSGLCGIHAHAAELSFKDAQALAIAAGGVVGCGSDAAQPSAYVDKAAAMVTAEGSDSSTVHDNLALLYFGARTMTRVDHSKCDQAQDAYDKAVKGLEGN